MGLPSARLARRPMNLSNANPDDQAAAWAARLDAGPLDRAAAVALQAWLDADPSNEASLAEVQQLHHSLRGAVADLVNSGRLARPETESAKPRRWWRSWAGLGSLAGAAVVAGLVVLVALRPTPVHYETAPREQRHVVLADGSAVELNAATVLDVIVTDRRREVTLQAGEAFFAVAHDADRPFVVITTAGRVRVTGTQFNVRHGVPNGLAVTVIEGSVQVTPAGGAPTVALAPGDDLSLAGGRIERARLSAADLDDALAWREGRLVFVRVTLAEAVARFAHYHGQPIAVDSSAAALPIGGRFDLDDLAGFLHDIESSLPVIVLRAPGVPWRITGR